VWVCEFQGYVGGEALGSMLCGTARRSGDCCSSTWQRLESCLLHLVSSGSIIFLWHCPRNSVVEYEYPNSIVTSDVLGGVWENCDTDCSKGNNERNMVTLWQKLRAHP